MGSCEWRIWGLVIGLMRGKGGGGEVAAKNVGFNYGSDDGGRVPVVMGGSWDGDGVRGWLECYKQREEAWPIMQ